MIGMYKKPGLPPVFDPKRQSGYAAAVRAEKRRRWDGMTPAQMCEAMDEKELNRNARKGGVAAIAEVERRAAESAPTGWTQELEDAENIGR